MFRFSFGLGCLYRQNIFRLQFSKAKKNLKKLSPREKVMTRIA